MTTNTATATHESIRAALHACGFKPEAEALAEWLEQVEQWQAEAVAAWIVAENYSHGGDDLPDLSDFEDDYMGEWGSFREYAEETWEQCGHDAEIPEHLRSYIDMDAWTRDLAYDYTTEPAPGFGVYVFRNR